MKVLFVVDEAYPLYKVGGLGDVGGSLPIALNKQGIDVRLVLPYHPEILVSGFKVEQTFSITYDHQPQTIEVFTGVLANSQVKTFLIKDDRYISQRTGAEDNNADKFAVFSLAVAHWLNFEMHEWQPDIVHLHDWHVSLIPLITRNLYQNTASKFMLTIHNLMYQGRTDTPVLEKIGFDPAEVESKKNYSPENKLNILLEGILASDVVTTVSQQYLAEIQTKEYGEEIEAHLIQNHHKLFGVLNGLDFDTFNPAKDKHIFKNYDVTNFVEGKAINKAALLSELGMDTNKVIPLIGFVGRVDARQKGVQLIIKLVEDGFFKHQPIQFVFLGTGDKTLEQELHQAVSGFKNIQVFTRYDEALAAKIYAASDLALIPSKFEPCGLVQMIAMRYGTLPVARATGGLKETIIDGVDGFLFDEYDSQAFAGSVTRALMQLSENDKMNQMQHQAMIKDFSWDASAPKYIELYTKIAHGQIDNNNLN